MPSGSNGKRERGGDDEMMMKNKKNKNKNKMIERESARRERESV
jgi:hypothetical protein